MNGRGTFRTCVAALAAAALLSGCALIDRFRSPAPARSATPAAPAAPAQRDLPCPRPEAEAASLAGWVLLSVRVRADGSVAGVKVVRAHPRGRFEDEAIDRVTRAKFNPKIVDGHPVAQEGLQCVEFERDSI